MSIELSDVGCPACGHRLQVIYDCPRKQVLVGWACPDCGFVSSEKERFQDRVPLSEDEEYVLRIEQSLTDADVRDGIDHVRDEFRTRAAEEMGDGEVWMLIDPEDGTLVDILADETGESTTD